MHNLYVRRFRVLVLSAWMVVAVALRADDMQTVSANVAANIRASAANTANVLTNLGRLNADGSFNDVDYADQTSTNWKTTTHLSRLQEMTRAYTDPASSLYHNESSLPIAKILSAYDYWVARDFQNPNWWYNEHPQRPVRGDGPPAA